MQPQDASGFDWLHIVSGAIGGVLGAVGGLIKGIWNVAKIEQHLRKDFSQELAEAHHELGEKLDTVADRFEQTLHALRQKINDVELNTEKRFHEYVDKGDFNSLRDEWRQDMRELKNYIADTLKAKP